MTYLFLLFIQILLLFFLSRRVQRDISQLIFKLTKSKRVTAYIYAILFLPGTYIHELSHLIVSVVLFVPVGKLEILPKYGEGRLRLGSVTIGKTDVIRRFIVGIAPLIFGIFIIMVIVYSAVSYPSSKNWWEYLVYLYLVFTVSNSMFMSKSDLAGGWKLILAIFVIVLLLYTVGVRFSVSSASFLYSENFNNVLKTANKYLLFPVCLDFVAVLVNKIFLRK